MLTFRRLAVTLSLLFAPTLFALPASNDSGASPTATAASDTADLSMHKYTTATSVLPNTIFDYVISLQNTGPGAASDVVMTDVLPAHLLFERVSAAGSFTCTTPAVGTNGTVTCSAASFPSARVGGVVIRVRVRPDAAPGNIVNRVTVTSTTPDPDLDDTIFEAPPVPVVLPAEDDRLLDPETSGARLPQTAPQVAATRQNALAVWREGNVGFMPPNTPASIRGALFRPEAPEQTVLEIVASESTTNVTFPAVAAATDRYLVVWRELKAEQGRILARRLRVDGTFIDAQPLVLDTGAAMSCCTTSGDARPAVASNGRDFYVTWISPEHGVRGIVVPAQGAVAGAASTISRDAGTQTRGRYDLELVWTSAVYLVLWLDRLPAQPPEPQFFDLRYARVSTNGVLLDTQLSGSLGGRDNGSITATPYEDGALVTIDFQEPGTTSLTRWECLAVLLFSQSGEPVDGWPLRCGDVSAFAAQSLRSKFVPVSRGFLLLQPGRRYAPGLSEYPVQTSSADHDLATLTLPKTLAGVFARELSVVSWNGAALLVYNRPVRDAATDTIVPRVFARLLQNRTRVRAVRH